MLQKRSPIVVILGHVDHGKTSLLDALLKTSIAAREAGGITQSTRAFQAEFQISNLKFKITLVDTPGHAAFSQMRTRGGKLADIALLIISGTDGVMPQTKESIATIKTAGIPYIVVLTKKDLADFSPDRVKTQLSENEVFVEDYGGDVPVVAVSAKTGEGLPELLEMVNLISEMNPPQADSEAAAEAIVLESRLDPKRGALAVVIVKNGILSEGQSLFLGQTNVGKVKALTLTSGERTKTAPPATPVEILGLTNVPQVGAMLSSTPITSPLPSPEFRRGGSTAVAGEVLRVILKADVVGSLEAIQASLDTDVNVVAASTGDVSESDILLADTSGAVLVGFNVKVPSSVEKLAETEKVKILNFKIIYELLDSVHKLAHPEVLEKILGRAQVAAEFKIDAVRVAGCRVLEGELKKGQTLRLLRNDVVMAETKFKSLRLGKSETEVVKAGQEFGGVFAPHVDFKTGDIIIAFEIIQNAKS